MDTQRHLLCDEHVSDFATTPGRRVADKLLKNANLSAGRDSRDVAAHEIHISTFIGRQEQSRGQPRHVSSGAVL